MEELEQTFEEIQQSEEVIRVKSFFSGDQNVNTTGLIDFIREQYQLNKGKLSRIDTKWGGWSTEMNQTIRRYTKTYKNKTSLVLVYLFMYWVIISRLLELDFKSKLGKLGEKRKLRKQARDLRTLIINPEKWANLKPLDMDKITHALINN